MVDWAALDFRKLYLAFSSSFERLPYAARALAADIIRRCDHEGRLVTVATSWTPTEPPPDEVIKDLSFLVRAHQGEEEWIRLAVKELIKDGYLVIENGWLKIRNYAKAQRSTSAERMARKRAIDGDRSAESDRSAEGDQERRERRERREEKKQPSLHRDLAPNGADVGLLQVFEHWLEVLAPLKFQRTPALTSERRRRISTRLREFSPAELCRAIDGVRKDRFLCGENDRNEAYVDFETIFRSRTKVEGHIARVDANGMRAPDLDARELATQRAQLQRTHNGPPEKNP